MGELNPLEHFRKSLIQTGVPSQIAHEFKLAGLPTFIELQTTCQNGIPGKQNTTSGTAAVQQVKPVAICDLSEMAETAALLKRPQTLSVSTIDRLPGQTGR